MLGGSCFGVLPLFLVAGPEGLEPPTGGLEVRCSVRLSYGPVP